MRFPRIIGRGLVVAALFGVASLVVAATEVPSDLAAVIKGPQRAPENVARDKYRHPGETLAFFGLKPDMTVVELSPGGGWFTEILAPYLRERGKLYAAAYPKDVTGEDGEYYRKGREAFEAKLAASPAVYARVIVGDFLVPSRLDLAPAGSADMVVTFRNIHNWMDDKQGELRVMEAAFKALKPGGVFGVEEHRTPRQVTRKEMADKGYVTEAAVI